MAKHQSTLTALGIVAPPEADTSNEMLADTSSSSQPDELHSPYDIGDVHHFAHGLNAIERYKK